MVAVSSEKSARGARATAAYVCMLANVCVQMHPSWAYDIWFTALPIAAAFALCVGRHCVRLGASGGGRQPRAAPAAWLRRLFPGAWWRVCVGAAAFAVAGCCFAVGLNDDLGPPQLVWHGCWHLFGGLGMWHLWQALPLSPPPPYIMKRAGPSAGPAPLAVTPPAGARKGGRRRAAAASEVVTRCAARLSVGRFSRASARFSIWPVESVERMVARQRPRSITVG